jgi:GntR family transcriptional regulator
MSIAGGTTTLLRADPEPLWVQIAAAVRADIDQGSLVAGSRLPPERELCERLSISRVTLRKALFHLVDEGILRSSHGRGWYVAATPTKDWSNTLESFSETARRMGLTATSRVLRCEVGPATLDEAEELLVAPGTPLLRLERVRMLNGVPIALDDSRVPVALVPDYASVDFATASVYELLESGGARLSSADSSIEARAADDSLAHSLEVEVGAPVLGMHQLVVTTDQRPALSSRISYAGERYRLRTAFARSASSTNWSPS